MMDRLFPDDDTNLLPYEGEARLYHNIFSKAEAAYYFGELQQHIDWKQEAIKIFGKTVLQPRLTSWYGDAGKAYSYSGITMQPRPWTALLLRLKEKIEQHIAYPFNSALLNLYRDGNDSMGWHRDNEKELGTHPVIASLSLGATRVFRFRHYRDRQKTISLNLEPGSVLLMRGATQTHWEHQLPKTALVTAPRINITFRRIIG